MLAYTRTDRNEVLRSVSLRTIILSTTCHAGTVAGPFLNHSTARKKKAEAPEFREMYAFDPRPQPVTRRADAPTALYESQLAFDSRRKVFVTVAVFNKNEHPSGMFAYDPARDRWEEMQSANAIPPHRGWHGWMKLCYASDFDCFIGTIGDRFFAYRPAASP